MAQRSLTACGLILCVVFATSGYSADGSRSQAIHLLKAASIKAPDYWYEDAIPLGRKDHQQLWRVWAASTPVRDKDAVCTSATASWDVTTDDHMRNATATDMGTGVIAYLGDDTDKRCTEYAASDYTEMDGGISSHGAIDVIKNIRATIKCYTATGKTPCGTWRKVDMPNGVIKDYFLNSLNAKVLQVARYDDGSIEVAFDNPKGERWAQTNIPTAHSVCTVRLNHDSSRDLEIGIDEGGPE